MHSFYTQLVTVFLGFFAIMNPVANTAAFAGLVGDRDKKDQYRIAAKALLITFAVILAFSLLGKAIFQLFGITLPALRITGGILVFLIGYHMLNGSGSKLHSAGSSEETDVAVSPLAVPLLAGPGTIATAMNYSASGGLTGIVVTLSVFALLCLITFICFIFSARILALIGQSGLGMVTRLMGLILAVIGTQMAMAGVLAFIKLPGMA
ncbi:MarC family protein [Gallaecimonas kandeliae]|uniref:MarC family protein n=1 Tax=Gallaecimonas kandeliae TaxID=3029055 RepID=UPI002648F3AE|nr:MarC family protein [Gallaecimonas kandeliae]WKE64254.1 MarC family protein [Gallaecimonas kandeliae]